MRIDHPRVADLAVSLVSPDGARALLFEDRGGNSTNGLGADVLITNILELSYRGGPKATTNTLDIGHSSGALSIYYQFYSLPDRLHIYRGNELLFDSGMVSYSNTWTIPYAAEAISELTLVMNQGDNNQSDTAWDLIITSSRPSVAYAVTEARTAPSR